MGKLVSKLMIGGVQLNFRKERYFRKAFMRILSIIVSISLLAAIFSLPAKVSAAETIDQSMFTDYEPTIMKS